MTESERIAVIGIAGRFPGARNTDEFWRNLRNGTNSLREFTDQELLSRGVPADELADPRYVKRGYVLEDADLFDAEFFGYTDREAETIDPQQRVFLEIAWEALENAGYRPDSPNSTTGVFAGISIGDYVRNLPGGLQSPLSGIDAFEAMIGNDPDYLATRLTYKLNLKGPGITIRTACSTSLVVVHMACQGLLTYECDVALAGAVAIRFPQGVGHTYQEGMIWSPDGYCRAFARARFSVRLSPVPPTRTRTSR